MDVPTAMNLLARLFAKPADPREDVLPLWHAVVALAREPHWYAECGVADTVPGRFDMVSAVLALVLVRMERDGDLARETAPLTELFVDDMEAQLRELGVGDIVVGKHIGKLVGALGGRINSYNAGLVNGRERMIEAVEANVTFGEPGSASCVADKLLALAGRLGRTKDEALLAGKIAS
jgi:cytochrome b pre-mRNA-processing protein 3